MNRELDNKNSEIGFSNFKDFSLLGLLTNWLYFHDCDIRFLPYKDWANRIVGMLQL